MRTLKPIFGVFRALGPVVYCGWLLYYFLGVGGSIEGTETIGLGPTVLGLGAVGLLFCIPLILKIIRLFARPGSPGSGGWRDAPDGDDGFDADAAIARYMARQSAEAASPPPAVPRAHADGSPAKHQGFGRKVR